MKADHIKLRERVKELNCLYKISRVAWEARNDIATIVNKTLQILPAAMQFPSQAEASLTIDSTAHCTRDFHKCKHIIESVITLDKKSYGKVKIGYRILPGKKVRKPAFLQEERDLLKAVARELSLFIKRAAIEDEKENLQLQLQHAERLGFVGELSAGIAHELNEPLGRILGFAQLIKKTASLKDQPLEDIERIIKASLYTREIIKKLMIFARQMPQQITSVNLNQVVENILYFIDVRFQSRAIKLVKQLDPDLPSILADEVQMSQVLVNLITNAVHAMPGGGEISVSTRKKGKTVALIIKDSGSGIAGNIRSRIFEPFFTTKPPGQGTGLGLSVVQGIIDSHGGKIMVQSSAGKGTKFEITLPLTQ